MHSESKHDWRARPAVSVADAARILGQSRQTVYVKLAVGALEEAGGPGPMRVTAASLAAYLDAAREERLARARATPAKARPHLRLVVDNT